ncbi:family 1 glycosylhydrolase [Amycolatopsis suaedae]|uniref:Glycoside hydrolase family 1 protein n=1 Tax=Amycolatopsis suaedae TaxID=2510978 RepID=A0A4Q7JDR0_9PSEU|nr:family 1 glycosylhydrolase [Amycolatopsis suaedae]RZQ66041.1 glycoside hydrolase family 1 protein [Amycolatopsis suaedae]
MRKLLALATAVAAVAAVVAATRPQPAEARATAEPFLWGVATAGFQSEGDAPDSNWRRYAEKKEPYRQAVDFRHRYAEDIANAAAMGARVFRFSVEWARVEPRPGVVDEAALAFYDDVVGKIRAAGMRPMITLDHWVYPGWAVDTGGWTTDAMIDRWLTNARRVVQRYAGADALWITFNEPTVYVQMELTNGGIKVWEAPAMFDRLVRAHRAAYDIVHELDPGAPVSSNAAYIPAVQPVLDASFLDRVRDKLDFAGLDFYYGASLDNPTAVHAAAGEFWKVKPQPDGLYYALRYYARKFPRLPLYVVENGMPTDNGKPRPDGYTRSDHLRDHIYWLQRAKADGIDVIGYNYWTITDNYEWGSYRPRFGLYTVDAATDPALTRRPTDAVATFRELVDGGGVTAGYRPKQDPGLCSVVDGLHSCLHPARLGPVAPLG